MVPEQRERLGPGRARVVDAHDLDRVAGFDDALLYQEIARPIPERRLPLIQCLASLNQAVFDVSKISPNRIEY